MTSKTNSLPDRVSSIRRPAAASLTFALLASQVGPAIPAITNDATSTGTYAGNPVTSNTSSQSVPVTAAGPSLTVSKSGAAPVDVNSDGVIGAGDTITYTYLVTNNGNVTINNVLPVDTGPTFNGLAAGSALGAFQTTPAGPVTLAPTQNRTFTAVYTLTARDADRVAGITVAGGNAVENSATATGSPATGTLPAVPPSSTEIAVPANPKLLVTKTVQTGPAGGTADAGETIVYLYTVQNTGNVTVTNATVNDVHEGAAVPLASLSEGALTTDGPLAAAPDNLPSTDTASTPGVWTTLRPGATVTFTYTHTVLQAEVDAG
jgi:hypothetical protein